MEIIIAMIRIKCTSYNNNIRMKKVKYFAAITFLYSLSLLCLSFLIHFKIFHFYDKINSVNIVIKAEPIIFLSSIFKR